MTPVAWYHNIPIASWFILRGRCANCSAPFSIRYAVVEAATATLAVAIWFKLSSPIDGALPSTVDVLVAWVLTFVFVADLIVIALIDLDTMRIPDILSLPGIALGLVTAALASRVTGVTIEESLLGLLFGGGTLLAITYGYFAFTGREGMGLGDYRLMAMVGAFLGWRSFLFLLVGSALQALAFALFIRVMGLEDSLVDLDDEDFSDQESQSQDGELVDHEPQEERSGFRHMAIPYGPFIALSALEWLILEPYLMDLFKRWVFMV